MKCEPVHLSPGTWPDAESCKQCQKDQVACTQTRTAIRFNDVSSKIVNLNHTDGPGSSGTQPKAKRHSEFLLFLFFGDLIVSDMRRETGLC